jgi:hypothetical protein
MARASRESLNEYLGANMLPTTTLPTQSSTWFRSTRLLHLQKIPHQHYVTKSMGFVVERGRVLSISPQKDEQGNTLERPPVPTPRFMPEAPKEHSRVYYQYNILKI